MDITKIQKLLTEYNIDAWMLYDFRGSNSIAWKICGIAPGTHCTRRWAVLIPQRGEALKIVSSVEAHTLSVVELRELCFASMVEWRNAVEQSLATFNTVCMEYSPNADLPITSKVDAGTVEWLRSLGKTIVSSENIAQHFQAVLSREQIDDNSNTAAIVRATMFDAFDFIKNKLSRKLRCTEFDVQQHIVRLFSENSLLSDSDPIVAIAPHASNPHYAPLPGSSADITRDQLVLIDMWAKSSKSNSVYADITWMCYTGSTIPEREQHLFSIIRDARNAALDLVRKRFASGESVRGYEVDDAARNVVKRAGFAQFFCHRTGHSITEDTHGAGTNMDNFETKDTREILRGTSFSIEPGIYIPGDIGLRTEISVVIDLDAQVHVPSEPIQEEIARIL